MAPSSRLIHRPAVSRWFVVAAVAGGLHTAITLSWAAGGTGLLWDPVFLVWGCSLVALWVTRSGSGDPR